jgi:hypothetical protein
MWILTATFGVRTPAAICRKHSERLKMGASRLAVGNACKASLIFAPNTKDSHEGSNDRLGRAYFADPA